MKYPTVAIQVHDESPRWTTLVVLVVLMLSSNVVPSRSWGALEFLLRYSTLDLDHAPIMGGRERDWTLGANWYLGKHLKLQANYVRAFSNRKGLVVNPRIFELRAQIAF